VTEPSGTNRWRLLILSETIAKCRTRKQQVVRVTEGRRPLAAMFFPADNLSATQYRSRCNRSSEAAENRVAELDSGWGRLPLCPAAGSDSEGGLCFRTLHSAAGSAYSGGAEKWRTRRPFRKRLKANGEKTERENRKATGSHSDAELRRLGVGHEGQAPA
jgi:hypothetical protein